MKQAPFQRVAILGSTGSIGTSTLDVLARHTGRFEVYALTAATQVDLLAQQCLQFKPRHAVMASAAHAARLATLLKDAGCTTVVRGGPQALADIAAHQEVDTVMAAIVGAAGLAPCLAAARAGKRLLLANKEALVVGGEFFLQAVQAGGATLLPIDSEHSAIFQSLPQDPATWSHASTRSSSPPRVGPSARAIRDAA
jgi:1-deoxy-D-xylulose-5-phosphate reductoisomerase